MGDLLQGEEAMATVLPRADHVAKSWRQVLFLVPLFLLSSVGFLGEKGRPLLFPSLFLPSLA